VPFISSLSANFPTRIFKQKIMAPPWISGFPYRFFFVSLGLSYRLPAGEQQPTIKKSSKANFFSKACPPD